jgi:type I restriction enzyme, S subunit
MSSRIPSTLREWWFGAVPENWRAIPLKHLCNRYSLYGANIPAEMYESDGVRFLRTTDIGEDGTLGADGVFVPREPVAESILAEGDFLISRSGTVGRAFVYRETDGPCSYAGYLVRYVLNEKRSARWLFYVTKSAPFAVWLGASAIEATIGNVNGEKYANLVLPVPPFEFQRAISDFLDRETARLDALVAAKQRLLDLLAEKRKAIIATAVTRGLDPKVKLRDSGVPWLGEIPAHWGVVQSRRLFRVRNELARPPDRQLTASQKYGILPQSEFVELEGRRVVELEKGVESLRHVEPNDFVISLRSFQGGLEWSKVSGSVTFHYVVLVPIKWVHPPFFAHLFKSLPFIEALRSTATLIRDGQDLRFSHFTLVDLPVVPLEEQRLIAAYLDRETAKLDVARAATERTIALLKERRCALIAAAVTGQLPEEALN